MKILFLFALIICTALAHEETSKYTKEKDDFVSDTVKEPKYDDSQSLKPHQEETDLHEWLNIDLQNDNIFKMQKLNYVWNSAKKSLSGYELEELHEELKFQEQYETELKTYKRKDIGYLEEKASKNFKYILQRFLPHDIPADIEEDNKILEDKEFAQPKKEKYFEDSELQTMWDKAKQSGISEDDLALLQEEFEHQQMNIHELNSALRERYDNQDYKDSEGNLVQKSDEEIDEIKLKLKDVNDQVKEGYTKLEQMMDELSTSDHVFKDSRVQDLWLLAKTTKWSEEELDSFQMELRHFEEKIKKYSQFLNKLENLEEDVDNEEELETQEKIDAQEKKMNLTEIANAAKAKMIELEDDLHSRVEEALGLEQSNHLEL